MYVHTRNANWYVYLMYIVCNGHFYSSHLVCFILILLSQLHYTACCLMPLCTPDRLQWMYTCQRAESGHLKWLWSCWRKRMAQGGSWIFRRTYRVWVIELKPYVHMSSLLTRPRRGQLIVILSGSAPIHKTDAVSEAGSQNVFGHP